MKIRAWATHTLAFLCGSIALLLFLKSLSLNTFCSGKFDLLSPNLECDKGLPSGEWDYEPLRNTLLSMKQAFKDSGKVTHISVYFRDLDHGPRFGIGEYDEFHPASLRKLAVLIAYLHMADLDPGILDKTLSFSGTLKINMNVEESHESIEANTPYTIRELLTKMIVYSDNYSYTLLTNELNASPPIIPYYTFRDLGVLSMMLDPRGEFVSIQSYSSLLAVLYNTGYLSKEMSQYALNLLTQVTFKNGLVAGLPNDVRVAHKFGKRVTETEGELHDCGIVYHAQTTYILCVMTSGTDFIAQETAIAEVSSVVYDMVSTLSFDSPQKK